jgi:nucleoside-diphosphate-sugar epimerase
VELTHAADVADAFLAGAQRLLASEAPRLEAFLVPGTRLTVRALVAKVAKAAGRPIQVQWGGRPYRSREVMVPVTCTGNVLPGWSPKRTLEQGLAEVYAAAQYH